MTGPNGALLHGGVVNHVSKLSPSGEYEDGLGSIDKLSDSSRLLRSFAGTGNWPLSTDSHSESSADEKGGGDESSPVEDLPSSTIVSPLQSFVQINIPMLDEVKKAVYEPLPGHDMVESILHRISDGSYQVQFYDGHREEISKSRLLQFPNGPHTLSRWAQPPKSSNLDLKHSSQRNRKSSNTKDMLAPRNGTRRRATRQGFLDWGSVELSEDELGSNQLTSRRSSTNHSKTARRRKFHQGPRFRSRSRQHASLSDEANTSSEDDSANPKGTRRSVRLRMSSRNSSEGVGDDDDGFEDENDESPEEDEFEEDAIRVSGRQVKRRGRPPLNPQSGTRRKVRTGSDSDEVYVPNRRSSRHRNAPVRSMREKGEDEISENEVGATGIKVVATKETFLELSERDLFRLRHRQVCDSCDKYAYEQKNPLIFCQGCTTSYHKDCLGPRGSRDHLVTKVGPSDFVLQCRRCVEVAHNKDILAPELSLCQQCNEPGAACSPFRDRKTSRQEQAEREANEGDDPIHDVEPALLNNADKLLFRCATCHRGWHIAHLPPFSPDDLTVEVEDEKAVNNRLEEYSHGWTCRDCFHAPSQGIEGLVAFRPTDADSYVPGTTSDLMPEDNKEYLVKWKKLSYFKATWMPGAWVAGVAPPAMRRAFNRKEPGKPKLRTEEAIPEDWLRVDIVLQVKYTSIVSNPPREVALARVKEVNDAYVKYKGLGYEDLVWETPPTPEEGDRWLDFKAAYEDFISGQYINTPLGPTLRKRLNAAKAKNFEQSLVKRTQPEQLVGGKMMDYQMEGLNWLYYKWHQSQNAILADEMGLGKTIQLIALFSVLVTDHSCWPFLVVVPNATCPNWRREIKKWAPHLHVVAYYGSAIARNEAYNHELFPKGAEGGLKCHVVVTSYEAVVDDNSRKLLRKVSWAGLVVDEGQRLKNDKSLMYEALRFLKIPYQILMTGTPLQNNARELFNLLQFIDSNIDAKKLEVEYENLTAEKVSQLHALIRPYFLRRTKAQVLTFLPPMAQIIIPVSMSVVQKQLYKAILAKNPQLLKAIYTKGITIGKTERHNLNNILMQLRKCLCHPFVYSASVEERTAVGAVSHRNLVDASSKLKLLEIMLPKLHERGHRVLIFSQFLDMMDIVEDFLDVLGLQHRRLDGTISAMEKQKRIDDYNKPNSPYFAFLLSTRAGGVGINLATADTVIIMDPDFNPHQDIQALSRAHRIGQTKKVLVFQLMTRASAEEKIMAIGKKKMALDHILIERMDAEEDAGVDLESILRHGASALFQDDDSGDIHYTSASVDNLLDRSQAESTQTAQDDTSAESQFSFARVWTTDRNNFEDGIADSRPEDDNPGNWSKLLEERQREAEEEEKKRLETFGRGKRNRAAVDYNTYDATLDTDLSPLKALKDLKGLKNTDESDTDFQARGESEADSQDEDEDFGANRSGSDHKPRSRPRGIFGSQAQVPNPNQVRAFKRAHVPQVDGTSDDSTFHPVAPYDCLACGRKHALGYCPLKLAGVEHCGLCGLAHFGRQRTCPHLHSELQVGSMLAALKQSTEDKAVVDEAKRYLRNIRGALVKKKRARAEQMERESSRLELARQAIGYGFEYSGPTYGANHTSDVLASPAFALPSRGFIPTAQRERRASN